MNQCDGCRRGLPIRGRGIHYNPDSAWDMIGCTAYMYGVGEFCPRCGAGIGVHKREGEGACHYCDWEGVLENQKRQQGRWLDR